MNWKTIFHKKNNNRELISQLLNEIIAIRQVSTFLVLVPGTTGYNWMGVNRATTALFPSQHIVLPQFYSQSIFSESEQEQIIAKIKEENFKQIVFSGYPNYFSHWMRKLKYEQVQIALIYHGFFSELSSNKIQINQLKEIIELIKSDVIDKIAFNKKGMGESLSKLWDINAYKIILKTPFLPLVPKKDLGIHIGVLGNDQFRKNLHNQVVAAALTSQANIHVMSDASFDYLPKVSIIRHQTGQSHNDFTNLLGSMHINLHLSYSESWGQLTTESLTMGVPCLIANHSDIFDYDEELKNKLVVNDFDNSFAISKQIERVLEEHNLGEKCRNYIEKLNDLSDASISTFLEA